MGYVMDIILNIMFWIIMVYLLLCFIRVLKGPAIWDRVLGMNVVATKIIITIIIYASLNDTAFLLDFAIIYTLSGFIGTIYIALFFADRRRRKEGES
jgi:multicomponent Na+:H+ antiporter subunit F